MDNSKISVAQTLLIDADEARQRARLRAVFLAVLFVFIFIATRLFIHPINETDYRNTVEGLQAFWRGQSMYTTLNYYLPPWSAFWLAPLVNQPIETWLALTVAFFVTALIDLGTPVALLLLLHPAFVLLIASANPEWLVVGPGLWLLYRTPKGWGRGLAWLLMACKPQTTGFLLLFDGIAALRECDWRAIGLAAGVAISTLILLPGFFQRLSVPFIWSATVLSNYGVLAAFLVTLVILALRWLRLRDQKTLGLLLGPVWAPYMLQYSYTAVAFTLRRARWWQIAIYVAGSIGLAAVFWQDYHVAEQIGTLGMVLLAALLAPAYPIADPLTDPVPLQSADVGLEKA